MLHIFFSYSDLTPVPVRPAVKFVVVVVLVLPCHALIDMLLSLFVFAHNCVQVMKVAKCPTDDLSLTNCAIVSEQDFDPSKIRLSLDCYKLFAVLSTLKFRALCEFITTP